MQSEYPFDQNEASVGDCHLNYVDEGQGRAVVMLHGNPTWSFYYRNVIKSLRGNFRCLALDHMGCGLSDKPQDYPYNLKQHIENAVRWIEGLDLEFFDLIVHDWGGAIGMGVAMALPEKVRKIVILNTAAFYLPRIPKRIALCRIPLLGDLIVRGFNGFAGSAVSMAVKKPLTSIEKDGYLLPYNNWKNRVATLRFVQDIPTDTSDETFKLLSEIEAFLPQLINKPILLGWGIKDFCFNDLFLEKWKNIFPNAKVLSYPNSGHYILDDERDSLIPEISSFLTK
ncbi:alpha/beta fold hydrolase [Opitutia bacterium ISCC 51]|nr:alpha/beta fold hydrolase [Opitutae bacterium ISCC 51]QXD30387.1 alpha/beta fold hydrolase [Opitutae bacterium ISCC 52]